MMFRSSWKAVVLVGAGMMLAGLLVACGGDDNDASAEGGSGSEQPETEAPATATPPVLGEETPGSGTGSGVTPSPPNAPTFDDPPVTMASVNGQSVETGIGTYCWTTMCVDKIGVPTKSTLTVQPGDVVTVAVPTQASALREAAANAFEAVGAQTLDDGSTIWPYPGNPGQMLDYQVVNRSVEVKVDLEPGQYVLAVSMYFEAGDVVYGVLLDVK